MSIHSSSERRRRERGNTGLNSPGEPQHPFGDYTFGGLLLRKNGCPPFGRLFELIHA